MNLDLCVMRWLKAAPGHAAHRFLEIARNPGRGLESGSSQVPQTAANKKTTATAQANIFSDREKSDFIAVVCKTGFAVILWLTCLV